MVSALSRLLDRALRRLGEAGEEEPACRIAADAWALLEGRRPAEAQRFDGTLHYLTLAVPKGKHAMPDEQPWDFEVECPAHGSRFDVRTGEVRNLPATLPVRTHRIRIEKDQVVIES